jgi:predicted glutamine amidotransferase
LDAFYPLCSTGCVKKGMPPGHADGWGISGFHDERAVYFARQPESAARQEEEYRQATERAAKSKSKILLAHFRKTSGAAADIVNTHPFHHQDWMFAHEGTVFGAAASFPLISAQPQGTTDSELFFLWIQEQIHAESDPTQALVELLKRSREGLVYTSLNFLLSDGRRLWAYREFGDKCLDKDETVKDREDYYTLFFANVGSAVVFCSEPLVSLTPQWTPMHQRTLAVVTPEAPVPQLIKI